MRKLFVTITSVAAVTMMTGCTTLSQNMFGTAASTPTPSASTPAAGQSIGLIDMLVQQLGVSPQQAAGGTGSILSVAKQSMNPADFTQVSQAIPNMNQYMSAVPAQTGASSSTTTLLGSMGGNARNTAALASSFQSLGMNADMAGKFIPIVLQYVQSQGGPATMGLLKKALLP